MESLVLEVLGRYIVTGIVAHATLFAIMFTRIIWFMVKGTSGVSEVVIRSRRGNEWTEQVDKRPKASLGEMLLRFVVWPYGVIKIANIYFKEEPRLIRILNGKG